MKDDPQFEKILFPVPVEELGGRHLDHLVTQYKLYVDMADKVSTRRMVANTFFVGMNTAVAGALAVSLRDSLDIPRNLLFGPAIAALLMCLTWWMLILSYRQLNAGKYRVILAMEKRLPSSPYTAEWAALSDGRSKRDYLQITNIELLVPWLFAAIHVALGVVVFQRHFPSS